MSPLLSGGCVAIRHPGQVPQRGTRAGIQTGKKSFAVLEYLKIHLWLTPDVGSDILPRLGLFRREAK
jgi:hypothetical protein